ncbi:MAG: sigma-70 family RNA polymerase sigma factor [Bacilli bacterium]|nr:sigma-70 family RNA polymerase sigma factor [Bacilli bacterium]
MRMECNTELNEVILDNQNLIRALSSQYDYRLRDDLFQVGVIGMIDAYYHYDASRNTKFSSYAYPYVLGEMKKFVREDRNIKVSRDIIYLCSRIEKAKDILRQRLHREPLVDELSPFLEISEGKIIEALQFNSYIKSIDEPINRDGRELTIKDVVGVNEHYDKLDLICLRDELNKLSPKEKGVIEKRYFQDLTQSETAMMMGLTQVDVSRTERDLIKKLKNKLQ